jgi:uncharacterized protein YdaU (DUF1376 family)
VLDLLMAEAVLGRDAEEFLSTELGRYITGRCDQEIAEAQDALGRVSPWRRRRIQALQNEIWRAQSMKGWLAELITNGKAAEAAMEEQA